ncbi:MAG: dicarboxylate/amino acid:cation symporter [Sciscionella sp.]
MNEPSPHTTSRPATVSRRRRRLPSIGIQILIALVLGVALGLLAPALSEHLKVVGGAFIRLIEMSIVPLLFPLIVLSIARLESATALGRLAGKSILYFEVVTIAILVLTLALAFVTGLGKGTNISTATSGDTGGIHKSIDVQTLFLDIIPKNIFSALGAGNLLAILFFAVFFGLALSRIGSKSAPVIAVLDAVAEAMFTVIAWVVRLAPLAVISFVAYNTAHYGWHLLLTLALFVAVFYAAVLIVLAVVFPLVGRCFGVPYFAAVRRVSDLVLLAFVTRSSEVVLAPLIKRLGEFGVDPKMSSFVIPLGYSFNADGATMYEGLAVVFIANAFGIPLSITQLITAMLVLMLLTKGIAGIPSSSIVVLFAASAAIGLPSAGVAILLAVDFVVDMARTALNVTGNTLAALVVAKSEGSFNPAAHTTPALDHSA